MKKRSFLLLVISSFIIYQGVIFYLNSGETQATNEVWTAFVGRDTTVGILPDAYANYYTYTSVRTSDDIGFKITGLYPDSRYFSFNVYSLGDNATQGSIIDHEIIPDSGFVNPFISTVDRRLDQRYTIYIAPDKGHHEEAKNILYFKSDARLIAIVLRLYDYNRDDTGGVPLPYVQAIDISKPTDIESHFIKLPRPLDLRKIVRRRSLPGMVKRLSVLYETEQNILAEEKLDQAYQVPIPFHAIDTKGYIENNDNRYLLAGITRAENEVYVFKFKSPDYVSDVDDIIDSQVRYWSFNLGNAASYNFNAIKDDDALTDSLGYVTIVLGDKDQQIQDLCLQRGFNFMHWNMTWNKALILFRHMLADPSFEAQIDDVPAISSGLSDFKQLEASKYMGDYAPRGLRMSTETFINRYEAIQ